MSLLYLKFWAVVSSSVLHILQQAIVSTTKVHETTTLAETKTSGDIHEVITSASPTDAYIHSMSSSRPVPAQTPRPSTRRKTTPVLINSDDKLTTNSDSELDEDTTKMVLNSTAYDERMSVPADLVQEDTSTKTKPTESLTVWILFSNSKRIIIISWHAENAHCVSLVDWFKILQQCSCGISLCFMFFSLLSLILKGR